MAKEILITGEIGYSLTVATVRAQLQEAKGGDLDVTIASPGGSVYDGFEIYNLFRDYKRDNPRSRITVTLKGLAASMASYIACVPVADRVVAEDNAVFMIHNPWSSMAGDHRDMMKTAEVLQGLAGLMSQAYATRSGKPVEEITGMMNDETWFFGEEIKKAGFAHEIVQAPDGEKDRGQALSLAKTRFQVTNARLAADDRQRQDIQKAAALIGVQASTQGGASVSPKTLGETASQGAVMHKGHPVPCLGFLNNFVEDPSEAMAVDEVFAHALLVGQMAGRGSARLRSTGSIPEIISRMITSFPAIEKGQPLGDWCKFYNIDEDRLMPLFQDMVMQYGPGGRSLAASKAAADSFVMNCVSIAENLISAKDSTKIF